MKRLLISFVVVAALAAPSAALANGVVLKVQRGHHLVAVTRAGTTNVALVHTTAAARLHVGQRVALSARTLRNGTLAASTVRVVGRAHTVRFRGLLLAKSRTRMIVSAGGAVISVNKSSTGGTSPATGSTVEVTATVGDDDDLDEDDVTTVSADTPGGAIEGKLTLGIGKITVVAEHMALVLNVPAGFDLSKFENGEEVLARFTQGADGTLTLTALSDDENAQRADEDENDDNDDDDDGGGHHDGGGEHGGGDGD
jgi:hypothetical protein